MLRRVVFPLFHTVIPVPYLIIWGLGDGSHRYSLIFSEINGQKVPILRLDLSISPKDGGFCSFYTLEQELTPRDRNIRFPTGFKRVSTLS